MIEAAMASYTGVDVYMQMSMRDFMRVYRAIARVMEKRRPKEDE